jgi:hypothetical protein
MKFLLAILAVILTAMPVLAQSSGSNWSGYIPNPSDEQALAAFNDLQDQLGKSHANRITYYAKDDSYHWIGPKYHKPLKMVRQEFDSEVWYPYWKKQHPTVEASRAELVATPTATTRAPFVRQAPATPAGSVSDTPVETTSHLSDWVVAAVGGLIVIGALIYGLVKLWGGSVTPPPLPPSPPPPPPLPVNNPDLTRQIKTLQVLLLANQPGAANAIDCLKNPRVDSLSISDSTGHVIDLKGENGEPWLIPYRCSQYMRRQGEVVLWGFDNVKYYQRGTHSEWHGGHAGISFRVAKGLWVRTGTSRGHSVSHQSMDFKGTGTLLLTNRGFAFLGAETIRVLFTHIVSMDYYKDGVGFETDPTRNNRYVFANMQGLSSTFVKDAIEVLNGGESSLLQGLNG